MGRLGGLQEPQSPQHYKATIAYDGTDFLGYQIQAQGRTVQGEVEKALNIIARKNIRVVGAGRTDTGVHATGQVIAFGLNWRHPTADLHRALNANLPPDIALKALTEAEANFHPRFDALNRQYRYTVLNQPTKDVLRQRYSLHISRPVDVDRMQQASIALLGTHDFASFGKPPQGNNTVRTVFQADWQRSGSEITFNIGANAFLYRMVRNIVGTLLQTGLGQMTVDEFKAVLQARDRSKAGPPALSRGLCLVKVNYKEAVRSKQ